jgi:hypothetical protein
MSLETALNGLHAKLRRLHEALLHLTITLSEDHPNGEVSAAQRWADCAENLRGVVRESMEASRDALKAMGPPADLERIRAALGVCHQSYNKLAGGWIGELSSFQRVEELASIGRERGREWQAWSGAVEVSLDHCHRPLSDVAQALLDSWREMAERAAGVSVSVNATARQFNLGSQERQVERQEA